LQKQVGKGFD